MVNHEQRLDRVFGALVSPARRAILARLEGEGCASVSDLARPIAMKLPAVMKHLDVLDHAGLITRTKVGRTMLACLAPAPMAEAASWLQHYERFWSNRLDRLTAFAEAAERNATKGKRNGHAQGWNGALDKLERHLRSGPND